MATQMPGSGRPAGGYQGPAGERRWWSKAQTSSTRGVSAGLVLDSVLAGVTVPWYLLKEGTSYVFSTYTHTRNE